MALKGRQPPHGLPHHSDRGSQYASEDAQQLLEARGIQCRMSRKGHCGDNAVAESFFSRLTREPVASVPTRLYQYGNFRAKLSQSEALHGQPLASPPWSQLHELIRQYAAEALRDVPAEHRGAEARHAAWYAARLEALRPDLEGVAHGAALAALAPGAALTALAPGAALAPEMDNVRAAWSRAVAHGDLAVLAQALDGFCLVHALRGHFKEALAALSEAAIRIRGLTRSPGPGGREARLLLGRLLARQGHLALEGAPLAGPTALLEEGLELLRDAGAPVELRFALDVAGRLASRQGGHAAASWCFRGSLALSRELEDPRGMARALSELSASAASQGDFPAARTLLEQGLGILRTLGDGRGVAACLDNLGDILAREGQLARAEQVYRDALRHLEAAGEPARLARLLGGLLRVLCLRGALDAAQRCGEELLAAGLELEHPETLAAAHLGLGRVALERGAPEPARRAFAQALSRYRELGARHGVIESLVGLGRATTALGEPERAESHFRAALTLAMEVGATPGVLDALVELAALPDSLPRAPHAREALACIATHPAAEPDTRERAARLLSQKSVPPPLAARSPPDLPALVRDVLGPAR